LSHLAPVASLFTLGHVFGATRSTHACRNPQAHPIALTEVKKSKIVIMIGINSSPVFKEIHMRLPLTTVAALAVLAACGGGGGGNTTVSALNGVFVNSPTKGIKYAASPSGLTGTTDENGTYSYKTGDTVTFSLDLGASTLPLGSTANPSATTSILSLTVPNGGDPVAVAQVLETLDKSTADGKMDVSGISLQAGSGTLTKITNALQSSKVTSVDIASIATGVQTALANAGTLKYGTTGVTQNDALNNLAKNSANQALVEAKIQNLTHDGSSTLLNAQDKPAFTSWIIRVGNQVGYTSRFGLVSSQGLTFNFRAPTYTESGTYTFANGNRNGNWVSGDASSTGVFRMISSETNSFAMTYANTTTSEQGVITGTYLQPLTLDDIKSKSFTIYQGCANGTNNTVTISSTGLASDTCGSNVNGATFSAGPYNNTLQYVESGGTRHYIGITRMNKGNSAGNLPSGALGAFMDISSTNSGQPSAISFKVN
jgi:hypothetical protein